MITKEAENNILLDVLSYSVEGKNKGFYWNMARYFVSNCADKELVNNVLKNGIIEIFGCYSGYHLINAVLDNGDYCNISEDEKEEFLERINLNYEQIKSEY